MPKGQFCRLPVPMTLPAYGMPPPEQTCLRSLVGGVPLTSVAFGYDCTAGDCSEVVAAGYERGAVKSCATQTRAPYGCNSLHTMGV